MNPTKTNLITSLFVYVFNEVCRDAMHCTSTEVVLLRKLGINKVICPIFIRVKNISLIYYKK
jgi:hypothetical protein